MPPPASHALLAAVLAFAAPVAGCSKQKEAPAPSSGGSASSSPKAGIKIPLPPGWSALVAADGSFQSGPPGKPVLRVDLRRGEGDKMPTVEALTAAIRQQFSGFQLSLDQEEGDEQVALVRVTLAPQLLDGGLGPHGPALLGARRVGDDLFLCATLPGATPEQVRLATEACRDIQLQPAPLISSGGGKLPSGRYICQLYGCFHAQ